MSKEKDITVESIKPSGLFRSLIKVIDNGLLGRGMSSSVRSVSLVSKRREVKNKALKIYDSNHDNEGLKLQKLTYQFLKLIRIPTLPSFKIINQIHTSDGLVNRGVLTDNLYNDASIILASDTFKKHRKGSPEVQKLIQSIDKEKLRRQIEKIVRRATWFGVRLAPDAMFILVDINGSCRPIIADLEGVSLFDGRKKIKDYNLSLIQDFVAYVDHSTT